MKRKGGKFVKRGGAVPGVIHRFLVEKGGKGGEQPAQNPKKSVENDFPFLAWGKVENRKQYNKVFNYK